MGTHLGIQYGGGVGEFEPLPDPILRPGENAEVRARIAATATAMGLTVVEFDVPVDVHLGDPEDGPFDVVAGVLVRQRQKRLLRLAMSQMAELYADRAGAVRAQQAGEPGPWAAYLTEMDARIAEVRARISQLLGP